MHNLFCFWLLPLALLAPVPGLAATGEEECQAALLESVNGPVTREAGGSQAAAAAGDALAVGDSLVTAAGAFADLRLCDGTGLRVGENSRFQLAEADGASGFWSWAFQLAEGMLRASVKNEGQGEQLKVRVHTPTAALGVRGTEFVVETAGAKGETSLHTLEGEVLMGPPMEPARFRALEGAKLRGLFEPVRKEQMSRILRGEARARRAQAFSLGEYRRSREGLFRRALEKTDRGRFHELRNQLRRERQGVAGKALPGGNDRSELAQKWRRRRHQLEPGGAPGESPRPHPQLPFRPHFGPGHRGR